MGWTPLYLDLQDKNVLVVGSGEVGQRRAQRFLSSGANVIIISRHTSDELKKWEPSTNPGKSLKNG